MAWLVLLQLGLFFSWLLHFFDFFTPRITDLPALEPFYSTPVAWWPEGKMGPVLWSSHLPGPQSR
jgi:hypothetical protein